MSTPYPIRIFDVRAEDHNSLGMLPRLGEDEFERLQQFYKLELDFTHGYERAQDGQLFWGIAGLELKAGPAILQPQVIDQSGRLITGPDANILIFLHWPGVDPLPSGFDPRYEESARLGWTEGKGNVGWGFGPESHLGEDGGPFVVWVSSDPADWQDRRVGSDAVRKLGWWDDHIIANPIFQEMRKGGGEEPPADGAAEYLVNVVGGVVTGHIEFVPGPPPSGVAALGLMCDGVLVAHIEWN